MVGVVLYTLLEFVNFYLAYRSLFGIQFTKRKMPYVVVIMCACIVQMLILIFVDDTWRDITAVGMGFLGAIFLGKGQRKKVILLYPVVTFIPSLINILGSFIIAALFGVTQAEVVNSTALTLISECTAIIVFAIVLFLGKGKDWEQNVITKGQYVLLLVGACCFFIIIAFSQGLLEGESNIIFLYELKNVTAVVSMVIAFFFMGLCIWQQITWKRALQYQLKSEKYKMFLEGQEEHIRMLILGDENRRKLHHDMNAHMLALKNMVEKEEWEALRIYLAEMQKGLDSTYVRKYTTISAVDAIIAELHSRALNSQVEWFWEGTLQPSHRITLFELCTIFSNLLSNAVEAVEGIEKERCIITKVSNFQGKIVISVRNTCEKKESTRERPKTTKKDKEYHGLGLQNVEEIVKKQEGSIEYTIQDGWFQVDIVL